MKGAQLIRSHLTARFVVATARKLPGLNQHSREWFAAERVHHETFDLSVPSPGHQSQIAHPDTCQGDRR